MNYISKTREGAKVFTRSAGASELSQDNFPVAQLAGTSKIGTPTVEQLQLGIDYPNVQSAIDDLVNIYQLPIDSIISTDSNVFTLEGVNMVEELTVTGQASSTLIEVYGVPVAVTIGDNEVAITNKILAKLNLYKDKNVAFKTVALKPGANNVLEVTFLDTNPHLNLNYTNIGLSIVGITTTPAKSGYGTWTKIGTSIIDGLLAGSKITLHYFKRTA